MMIVGITGSFGAGKGAVVDYLTQQKGFRHFSARNFICKEVIARGLPVDRDSLAAVGNDLRAEHGPTYIIESLFRQAEEAGEDAIIESIREVAGAHFIQKQGGVVLGVNADPKVRFERAVRRGSETDEVTFDTWLEQERRETNPDDPTKQDIFGALKASDEIIENDGTLEELHEKIDAFLAKYR